MLKLLHDPPQELSKPHLAVFTSPDPHVPIERSVVVEGFLRREELAKQLGCSARTIDRWQALREGPPRVRIGRTILYNVESVRVWLRSREEQSSSIKTGQCFPRKKRHNHPTSTPRLQSW